MSIVDLSNLSHSYPFLHLSRKFDIPYSLLLELVDIFERGTKPITELEKAIAAVCKAPWRWQFPPEGKGL